MLAELASNDIVINDIKEDLDKTNKAIDIALTEFQVFHQALAEINVCYNLIGHTLHWSCLGQVNFSDALVHSVVFK